MGLAEGTVRAGICLDEGGGIGGIGMKLEVEGLLRQAVSRGYE